MINATRFEAFVARRSPNAIQSAAPAEATVEKRLSQPKVDASSADYWLGHQGRMPIGVATRMK